MKKDAAVNSALPSDAMTENNQTKNGEARAVSSFFCTKNKNEVDTVHEHTFTVSNLAGNDLKSRKTSGKIRNDTVPQSCHEGSDTVAEPRGSGGMREAWQKEAPQYMER